MSVDLDPQEVLQHLYSLGYCNITKDQLKDFIKDLKKLIKYDLRKEERKNCIHHYNIKKPNLEHVYHGSKSRDVSPPIKLPASNLGCTNQEKSTHYSCFNHCSNQENLYLKPSNSSITSAGRPTICSNCHHTLDCWQMCSSKACLSRSGDDETNTETASEDGTVISEKCKIKKNSRQKKNQNNLKPCPSFIRPTSAKVKPPKADPVALYHYYKTLWSQHSLPGENSHEDLRWRIRHKMSAPPVLTKGLNEEKSGKKPEWLSS